MPRVIIMSGPSGAGKTHAVREIVQKAVDDGDHGIVVSTDHFWMEGVPMGINFKERLQAAYEDLPYEFDVKKLSDAHPACMKAFIAEMVGLDDTAAGLMVVDNTNIHGYEIAPYYLVAQSFYCSVEIVRVEAELDVCIERNSHNVPVETIERMHRVFSETGLHPWTNEPGHPKQHQPWWGSRTL